MAREEPKPIEPHISYGEKEGGQYFVELDGQVVGARKTLEKARRLLVFHKKMNANREEDIEKQKAEYARQCWLQSGGAIKK